MTRLKRESRPDASSLSAYAPAEAAHYLDIPVSTVRYWSLGRDKIPALIEPAEDRPLVLSFVNLVELHVLSAVRRKHRISMSNLRRALEYIMRELALERPLASRRFQTDGVDLFIDHYGHLINASERGQMAMKDVLGDALVRIEWDRAGRPMRLFPYTRNDTAEAANIIMIDPSVSGGRAVIKGTRIAIEVVAERYKSGESIRDLAEDYGRDSDEIEEAIRCELRIAA